MTMLTKIGNSQGIRIPKPIIKQAGLEGKEIEFEVVEDGLLLRPVKKNRQKWAEDVASKLQGEDVAIDNEMLDDSDLEAWEW